MIERQMVIYNYYLRLFEYISKTLDNYTNALTMKTLLTAILLLSSMLGIKSSLFVVKYERFAERAIENYQSFDEQEWTTFTTEYQQMRTQYKELAADMSAEQREKIDSLNYKLNAIIIRGKASKALGTVGEIVNEAAGTLKELLE